jgi:subtilisin family serine protease
LNVRVGQGRRRLGRALAIGLLVCAFGASAESPEPGLPCGPFDDERDAPSAPTRPAAPLQEPGITSPGSRATTSPGAGEILRLPLPRSRARGAAPEGDPERPGEALLALPKDASGGLPTDFELAPGARIVHSFFSPVLCATVARVVGPAGASPRELVPRLPSAAVVVANDVYASAAEEPVSAGPAELRPERRGDPYDSLQYGLAASDVRRARRLSDGSGVRVALLDSAPDSSHRDLGVVEMHARPRSEAMEAAEAGATGEAGESEPIAPGLHGTLMAGVIAAREGNGFGIAGLAPGARLVSVPVCAPSGESGGAAAAGGRCLLYDLLRGLDLAWEAEAQILNLSLTGPANPLLARGVARLEDLGLVVVAAAGNEDLDEPRYPAAYPSVIGVGAHDREGAPFARGNRGAWVELAAPGVEVLSTVPGDAFAFGDGTSLAAAHVTGLLAVLTGVTQDPRLARAELFRTIHASGTPRVPPLLPSICEVLARLDRSCDPSARPAASPPSRRPRAIPSE